MMDIKARDLRVGDVFTKDDWDDEWREVYALDTSSGGAVIHVFFTNEEEVDLGAGDDVLVK